MTLVKCFECNKKISDKASSCPGCGYPIVATEKLKDQVKTDSGKDINLDKKKNPRLCIKCNKRKGSWWDFLCEHCRSRPGSEVEVVEQINAPKNISTSEQIEPLINDTVEQKYNKFVIIGFVFSVVAIFGLGLAGIIGFILGIIALTQIRYTHEKGKGLAIAAIVIGFIWSFVIGIINFLIKAGY